MSSIDKPVSRREFARRTAALGTAAASTSLLPLAGFLAVPGQPAASGQTPPSAPKLSPESQAEADSRYQAILAQYPDRFSDAQKTDLKRLCIFLQPSLDHIRAYTVANGDLPSLYLKPLVDREKKPGASTAAPSARPASTPKP